MASAVLLLIGASGVCHQTVRNNASTPITLCLRRNADPPGQAGNHTLQPGETWGWDCPVSGHGVSHNWYFAVRSASGCVIDPDCPYATATCRSYPWFFAQGTSSDNGLWYGDIAANWDGRGTGFLGDYGSKDVSYGIRFSCLRLNATQKVSLECGVKEGKPYCDPNHPNLNNKPASGVAQCDPTAPDLEIFES
eukprot:Hpha_TRINITY_DN33587_c0_g1::TRINITY_DN33587_c0_g1_i1::g.171061::m.171061